MHRIAEQEQRIRGFVNAPVLYDRHFRAHPDDWHTLCAAMDALGDTALALQEFETNGLGLLPGERYLRLYGFMQAIFLQQDAIKKVADLLRTRPLVIPDHTGWSELRELRNLSAGHPLENTRNKPGTTKRVFVSRPSISESSVTLMVWDKNESASKFLHVNIGELYASYKREALSYLLEIDWDLFRHRFVNNHAK